MLKMVASKFLHDDGEDDEVFNTEWAESAGLTLCEMNNLEKGFLIAIVSPSLKNFNKQYPYRCFLTDFIIILQDWAIYVCNSDFWARLKRLETDIAYKEGRKRGWFSYTDLNFLMDSAQLAAVIQTVVSVSSICLATYAAGIATLLGSALVASQLPGTSLAPRQPVISSNEISNASEIPVTVTEPLPNEMAPVDVFATGILLATLSCNQSYPVYDEIHNRNSTSDGTGWEWWLSSLMTWLPDYSGLQSTLNPIIKDNIQEQTRTFVTNPKSVFDINTRPDNCHEVIEINWKETLSFDLEFPVQDWRRYAGYVAKISLGHRH